MANAIEIVNCPVCDAAPTKIWMDDRKPTRYVKCIVCETIYASPRASSSARFSWLDSTFRLGDNALLNAKARTQALAQESALLQKYVKGGRLLDVGCDLGNFFHWFSNPRWERYGVEISPSAAAFAANTYAAQVYNGSIDKAAYPDVFFDLVTMLDMLVESADSGRTAVNV